MSKLILEHVYDHEAAQARRVFLTQPIGDGQAVAYTWGQTLNQARRMATHLKSLGCTPGARIAILAKNSAHFFMAELAIWMAGGTTVAIFPTETAGTIRYVLEHSGASLLFVGKLDNWAQQAGGMPTGLPCVALPSAPPTDYATWDAIVARTAALAGRPARGAADVAMLLYTSDSTWEPNGVPLDFGRITHAVQCGLADPGMSLPAGIERRSLSYLPLAHPYERSVVECRHLLEGRGRVYFCESLDTFIEDIRRARPTIFFSVPLLWLKFQQAVYASMPPHQLDAMLENRAIAAEVGREVLAGLGLDYVLRAYSVSAPIPPTLLRWYRRLGLNLLEGYGMTENFAHAHRTSDGGELRVVGHSLSVTHGNVPTSAWQMI